MFGRKKKDDGYPAKRLRKPEDIKAWVEANEGGFGDRVGSLRQRLAEIGTIPDAGERYFALHQFETETAPVKDEEVTRLAGALSRQKQYLKTALFTVPFGILTIPVMGAGLFLLVFGPGEDAEEGLKDRKGKILQAVGGTGYFKALDEVRAEAGKTKDLLVENNMGDLALSPRFDDLYATFPSVKDAFVKASARQRALDTVARSQLNKPSFKPPPQDTAQP